MTTADAVQLRGAIHAEARQIAAAVGPICPDDNYTYISKAENVLDMIDELVEAGRNVSSLHKADRIATEYLCATITHRRTP